jgi:hypothetical protein
MGGMTVPHIFRTITGTSPIEVPASWLDDDFASLPTEISVVGKGAVADGNTDNSAAFAAAIAAAALTPGAIVAVPAGTGTYLVSSTIIIPQGVNLRVDGIISPGAAMTDLVKVTALENSFVYGTGTLANRNSLATNGVTFNSVTPGNNRLFLIGLELLGFVNNIRNVNADDICIKDVFSQNATGNTLYATAGTGMEIDGLKVLGDANGPHWSGNPIEGVIFTNSEILTTAIGAYAYKFDNGAGYASQVSNVTCQGTIIYDASVTPLSNVTINALYTNPVAGSPSTAVGVDIIGNCDDFKINGLTTAACPKAGLRIRDTTGTQPQRIYINKFMGLVNGTAAGSADLLLDGSNGLGIANIFIDDSSCQSVGGSVKSVIELGTVASSYSATNLFFSTVTLVLANRQPVSGGIPYIDSHSVQAFTPVLGANNVLVGGGAGNPPSSVANLDWNSGTGNFEVAGGFRSARTNGTCFAADTLTTNPGFLQFSATGNSGFFGTEGSAGGASFTGTAAYATLVGGTSSDTQFVTTAVVRGGVNNAGLYSITTVKTGVVTVGALPSAATAGAGSRYMVSNATQTLTAGIGATVAGGGGNTVPVVSDGTNWLIG